MSQRTRTVLSFAAAAAALAAVFALYTQPDMMVMLAEQIWLCLR